MLISIKKASRWISRALFPRKCVGCQAKDFWICEKCLVGIPKSFENPFDWSTSVFEYRNKVIRKAIWKIKFSKKYSVLEDLDKPMRESFFKFLEKKKVLSKEIILIPIPITKRSMKVRGYNQSLLICKMISKNIKNVKVESSALFKSKNHLPQNKIRNRNQRLENVKNSFAIKNKSKIDGQVVILVDDVTTTGATLKEAKKILKENGAKKVLGFSIAH